MFGRQKQWRKSRDASTPVAGVYEMDINVKCTSTFPVPGNIGLAPPARRSQPEPEIKLTREEAISLFIENQGRFCQCLGVLETYNHSLAGTLSPEEHESVFSEAFAPMYERCLKFNESLEEYRRDSSTLTAPIGALLRDAANDFEELFQSYSDSVDPALQVLAGLRFDNPVFGASVRGIQREMGTNMTLAHALVAPILQARSNAEIVSFIVKAESGTSLDRSSLVEAQLQYLRVFRSLPVAPELAPMKPMATEEAKVDKPGPAEESAETSGPMKPNYPALYGSVP